jgi:hypothetical protein
LHDRREPPGADRSLTSRARSGEKGLALPTYATQWEQRALELKIGGAKCAVSRGVVEFTC